MTQNSILFFGVVKYNIKQKSVLKTIIRDFGLKKRSKKEKV